MQKPDRKGGRNELLPDYALAKARASAINQGIRSCYFLQKAAAITCR